MNENKTLKEDIIFTFFTLPICFISMFFIFGENTKFEYFSTLNFKLLFYSLCFCFYIEILKSTNLIPSYLNKFYSKEKAIKEDIFNFITFCFIISPCLYFYDFNSHINIYSSLSWKLFFHLIFILFVFFICLLVSNHILLKIFSFNIFIKLMSNYKESFYFPEEDIYLTYFFTLNGKKVFYKNGKRYSEKNIQKDNYSPEYIYKVKYINHIYPLTIKSLSNIKNKRVSKDLINKVFLKSEVELSNVSLEDQVIYNIYEDKLYNAILQEDVKTIKSLIKEGVCFESDIKSRVIGGCIFLACFVNNMDIIKLFSKEKKSHEALIYVNMFSDILVKEKLIGIDILKHLLQYKEYAPFDHLMSLFDLDNEEHFKMLINFDRDFKVYDYILNHILVFGNLEQIKKALEYPEISKIDTIFIPYHSFIENKEHEKVITLYNHPKLEKNKLELEDFEIEEIENFLMSSKLQNF